jgi:hypothetical protein
MNKPVKTTAVGLTVAAGITGVMLLYTSTGIVEEPPAPVAIEDTGPIVTVKPPFPPLATAQDIYLHGDPNDLLEFGYPSYEFRRWLSIHKGVIQPPNIPVMMGSTVDRPEDINDDGRVDVTDYTLVIINWGPTRCWPVDIDCDGQVGTTDLVAVVLAWDGGY